MKLAITLIGLAALAACQTKTSIKEKPSASSIFNAAQEKLFKQHSEELAKAGRIPTGFDAYMYMSQYGWHSAHQSSVGTSPVFEEGGSFGAYTFSWPAFEQAKQIWIVSGFMLPGSDLLWIESDGIKFDKTIIGRRIQVLHPFGCYKDDGNTACEQDFVNPDYSKGLFAPVDGELRDAIITDVFGHQYEYESWGSDGSHDRGKESWRGPLRLNNKATVPLSVYMTTILPDGWVDMCACTIQSTPMPANTKPCVQGGSLAPGESCSVSIGIGGEKK